MPLCNSIAARCNATFSRNKIILHPSHQYNVMLIQLISIECNCDISIQIFYCQFSFDILLNCWDKQEHVINVFNLPAGAWVPNRGPTWMTFAELSRLKDLQQLFCIS